MKEVTLDFVLKDICGKCHKVHIAEYGVEAINCAFKAFDNEECPTVMYIRDLYKRAEEHDRV